MFIPAHLSHPTSGAEPEYIAKLTITDPVH